MWPYYIECTGCHIPEQKNAAKFPHDQGKPEHANILNIEFDGDLELNVVEEENIIFDNIQEEGLKEQPSCNKRSWKNCEMFFML